jgi:hypothetical protein
MVPYVEERCLCLPFPYGIIFQSACLSSEEGLSGRGVKLRQTTNTCLRALLSVVRYRSMVPKNTQRCRLSHRLFVLSNEGQMGEVDWIKMFL